MTCSPASGQLTVAMTTIRKARARTEKECCISSRSKPHSCSQMTHKYSFHFFQISPFYLYLLYVWCLCLNWVKKLIVKLGSSPSFGLEQSLCCSSLHQFHYHLCKFHWKRKPPQLRPSVLDPVMDPGNQLGNIANFEFQNKLETRRATDQIKSEDVEREAQSVCQVCHCINNTISYMYNIFCILECIVNLICFPPQTCNTGRDIGLSLDKEVIEHS